MIRCEFEKDTNKCVCEINGTGDIIAMEYTTLVLALLDTEGGQAILDKVTEFLKKEIDENEEKRRS